MPIKPKQLSTALDFEGQELAFEIEALEDSRQKAKVAKLFAKYRKNVHRLEARTESASALNRGVK